MFRFFTERNWYLWSWLGSAIILSSLWIQVKIDVKMIRDPNHDHKNHFFNLKNLNIIYFKKLSA